MRQGLVALLLLAIPGIAIGQPLPSDGRVSLRFDSVQSITRGSIADPFKIQVGPDGIVDPSRPVYVKASFKVPGTDRRMKEQDRRKVREVLQADRVAIAVEFPPASPTEKPIRTQGWLRPDFCCGKGLDGTFLIPARARRGETTLRFSWSSSGSLRAGSTTLDLTLGPLPDRGWFWP